MDSDSAIEVEFRDLCRICGNAQGPSQMIEIFGADGVKLDLPAKIGRYLPITVFEDDGFPHQVCISCTSRLNVCHVLVNTCVEANARLVALKEQLYGNINNSSHCKLNDLTGTNLEDHETAPASNASVGMATETQDKQDVATRDSQVAIIIAEKDEQADNPKLNIVVVNVPKEDTSSQATSDQVNAAIQLFKNSDSDAEEDDLKLKLEESRILLEALAEEELMQVEAAENFLKTLEQSQNKAEASKVEPLYSGRPKRNIKASSRHPKDIFHTERRNPKKRTPSKIRSYDPEKTQVCNDCKLCKRTFSNTGGLRLHNASHSHKQQILRLHCLSCNDKFENQEKAEEHECKPGQLLCQFCDHIFHTAQDLELHKLQHSNGPFTCALCGLQVYSLASLRQHITSHTDETLPYQCSYCGKGFKSKQGMQGHQLRHTNVRTYLCYICHSTFADYTEMLNHRDAHSEHDKKLVRLRKKKGVMVKRFGCEVCGKMLTSKAGLLVHIRMHTGEKPYSCEECGKLFSQAIKLRYHQRLHSGNMPYRCSVCDKRFNSQRQCETHMRVHTNERPYVCEICGMRFRSNGVLGRHRNTHSEEPLFSCSMCGKKFRTRYATTVHERSHTGEKRFMCDVCGRNFGQRTTLEKHRLRHEKQRVECLDCNTTFASRKGLKRHYERKHAPVFVDAIQVLEHSHSDYILPSTMDDLVVEVVV